MNKIVILSDGGRLDERAAMDSGGLWRLQRVLERVRLGGGLSKPTEDRGRWRASRRHSNHSHYRYTIQNPLYVDREKIELRLYSKNLGVWGERIKGRGRKKERMRKREKKRGEGIVKGRGEKKREKPKERKEEGGTH